MHTLNDNAAGASANLPNTPVRRRILITDDPSIRRDGLRALLESAPELQVVGAEHDSTEVLRLVAGAKPEIVLIDPSMRSLDGLSAIREIKRRASQVKVLVLTEHSSEYHIRSALQAGADGYLLTEASPAELLMAIACVLEGKRFITAAVSAHIVSMYLENAPSTARGGTQYDRITSRERQVLKLIAEGRRNREIAKCLFISVKTVEKHRSNLMHKMNLHNTAALTSLAVAKGLIGSGPVEPPFDFDGSPPPGPTEATRRRPS